MNPAPYENPKLFGGANAGTRSVSSFIRPTFFANVTRAIQLTSLVRSGRPDTETSMPRFRISALLPAL